MLFHIPSYFIKIWENPLETDFCEGGDTLQILGKIGNQGFREKLEPKEIREEAKSLKNSGFQEKNGDKDNRGNPPETDNLEMSEKPKPQHSIMISLRQMDQT